MIGWGWGHEDSQSTLVAVRYRLTTLSALSTLIPRTPTAHGVCTNVGTANATPQRTRGKFRLTHIGTCRAHCAVY